jgi:homoserine dehydrogenase
MDEVRLALIGFGNVAQGLTKILEQNGEAYAEQCDVRFLITGITDRGCGTAFDPEGLDPSALLAAMEKDGCLDGMPGAHPAWDAMEMIQSCPADVIVEMSYTNLTTGEPATSYIREALSRKKHVVTTNKGPIALHYEELANLARIHDVQLGVEGTVMSGTPSLRVGRELLCGAGIQRIQGILNGTTNYILTQMENGKSYADALAEAQRLGYAEADPTGDVEGFDAAAKVAILARLLLHAPVEFRQVQRQGITGITQEDITQARAEGRVWKLIGTVEKENGTWKASVQPKCLPVENPLARVSGATNAILYQTDFLGDVTLIGPGAGRVQTGYAVIQDLFAIYNVK